MCFFLNNKWIALSVLYLEKIYVYMLVLSTRLFLPWHNEFKLEENCQKREVSQRHMLLLYYESVIQLSWLNYIFLVPHKGAWMVTRSTSSWIPCLTTSADPYIVTFLSSDILKPTFIAYILSLLCIVTQLYLFFY